MIDQVNKIIENETIFIKSWLVNDSVARALVPSLNGWILSECDISQQIPHTRIFIGITNLSLLRCNCLNADFDAGTIERADECTDFLVYSPSFYIVGGLQVDGRRPVKEIHVFGSNVKIVEYLASTGSNYAAIMANRVPVLSAALADGECNDNLNAIYNAELNGGTAVLTFNHISASDSLVWLRGIYKILTRDQAGIVAGWILANVTDNQLKNIFNITSGQLAALKTRLTNNYNAWLAVKSVVGE